MLAIGDTVRVMSRGNALPTSAVGKVVIIAEVDTSGGEARYGFRYACRTVWATQGQLQPVVKPEWVTWQEQAVNAAREA